MAKEELGKLSPEQLKKLGKVISEAKDLTNQQAEIIEKVLAGEEDIGKLRISYLEEYFDIYSKELDRIARKHSALNDAFLVLDNKLNKNYKAIASDVAQLERQLKELARSSNEARSSDSTKKSTKETGEDTKNASTGGNNAIKDILQVLSGGVKLDKNQFKELLTKTRSALSNIKLDKDQYQTLLAKLSRTLVETPEAETKETREHSYVAPPIQQSENKSSVQTAIASKDHDASLNAYTLFQELYDRSISASQTTAKGVDDRNSATINAELTKLHPAVSAKPSVTTSNETAEIVQEIRNILVNGINLNENQLSSLITNVKDKFSDVTINRDQYQTLLEVISETAKEQLVKGSPLPEATKHENVNYEVGTMTASLKEAIKGTYTFVTELFDRSSPFVFEYAHADTVTASTGAAAEAAATSEDKSVSATPATTGGQPPQGPLVPPEPPEPPRSVKVENTVSEKEIAALKDTEKTAKNFLMFLDGIAKDGIKAYTQEADVKKQQLERSKALVESWARQEKAIQTSMLELAIAKLQTQEELENRSIEIRLSRLQEATDAELKAQQLLNQIDLQLAPDTSKGAADDLETGDTRARKTTADINIKAYQELEKQMADYRAKLDLETRLANNGELDAIQAAANEESVRKYFAARKDAIIKEARDELLAKEKLADLSKTNPKVAQEYEKRLADFRAKLDFESRQANNGILTEEAAKANERLAREDFANRREELIKEIALKQQFEAELAELSKIDSAAVHEFERRMADELASRNYETRLANNGELSQAAAEANAKAIREEFALRKEELIKEIALKQENPGLAMAREKQLATHKAELEAKLRTKLRRDLTKEELKDIEELAEAKFSLEDENLERISKLRKKEIDDEAKDRAKAGDKAVESAVTGPLTKENNLVERFKSLQKLTEDENGEKIPGAQMAVAVKALSTLVQQLEDTIDKVGSYKGGIDTRMQGSSNKKRMGSYWDQLTTDMMSVGAVTPYFKQEDFANNIKSLVEKGISFDLKQRAFLMTIQEKIANTFNVADGTLLRLIRIQQEDSTAGRLGMESALNSFLNNMYETSEYLTDVAASVRSSLEEMESLMKGAEATEVEFQVQKWMGSLYSVGMSQNAVTTIANALGQIASGQVDALTGNGAGNLLVMAANEAGLSIAEILAEGLDSKNTNKLLQATVNYLAEIAESSKGNNVVQQQLANVFGVKASDLKAAVNLAEPGSTKDVFGKNLTYGNMIKQLNDMANSMILRTSVGEFMTNVWENAQYSIASSMANNPITYLTYKLAGLLDEAVGGIDLPFINVMGFGVDLNTTVADLMRVASVTGGILGSLGPMISGLASSFSGQAMLSKMGIGKGSGLEVNHRGTGDGAASAANSGGGSQSTSGSGYAGQSNGNDVKNSTIQESEDSKKKQMIKAKEEEPANQVDVLNGTVLKIYELLDSVTKGNRTIRVRVDSYGLTGTGHTNTSLNGGNSILGNGSNSVISGGDGGTSAGSSSGNGGSSGGAYGETSGSGGSASSGGGVGSGYEGSGSIGGGNGSPVGSGGRFDLGGWTIS